MNEFKYQFVNFILLVLLGAGIYWAFTTIDNSVIYERDNRIEQEISPQKENKEQELFNNTKRQPTTKSIQEVASVTETKPTLEPKVETNALTDEEKQLLSKLQGLIDDKIQMKKNSRGTRVGTVQKFLNNYFNTDTTVDNVYGEGTIKRVKEFQTKEGIGVDGFAGPNTYKKMIEVLKK